MTGLAAAINKKFGLKAELIEGHNGIYEVAVNDEVIFTNQGFKQGGCRILPSEGEVLGKILKYAPLLPGEKLTMVDVLPMG